MPIASPRLLLLGLAAGVLPAGPVAPRPAAAQVPPALEAAVRRVFASRTFAPRVRFGPAVWIEGGAAYTTVEPGTGGGAEIVRYDPATGARSVFVGERQLTPSPAARPLDIDDYHVSPDGSIVLIFTNSRQVWRTNTRGDYWILDRRSGMLRQLGGPAAAPSSLMFAKVAPTADRVAYVRDGDLYVEPVAGGEPRRLTTDGDSLHVNGMTDWVYEEELFLQDGFRWAPDGRRIAYWHFDMTGVGTFTLVNYTDSLYPQLTPIQYPKAGTTNSAVTVGVVSVDGGPTRWIDLPGDPRNHYVARMDWAGPDSLVIQQLDRRQQRNEVRLASATTGQGRVVLTERDDAWIDPPADIQWLADGAFVWPSDRDGWRRIYRVNRRGDSVVALSPAGSDIVSIVGVTGGANPAVYYIASPDNPTQRYLYRVPASGRGRAERVSPADRPGTHGYQIAPNGRWAFHSYSTFTTPPTTALVSLPDHRRIRMLVDDTARAAAVRTAMTAPVERLLLEIEPGVTIDGWLMTPPGFDPAKKYPLFVYVYGEPWGSTTADSWGGNNLLWYQALAAQGYLVASFDNRGTNVPRGRTFRKSVYRQIGVLSSSDQAAAVRTLASTRPYVDLERIGIWGWSGGGSSTLQALFRHPDLYSMGMAVAPVPDQTLYDTIYQERYMGLPSDPGDAYARSSPIGAAEGLRGKLLLVHGSGDDNVHYQGSQRLINTLVSLGKQFDFMSYPNRSHCICEGPGTTAHVYATLTRYLLDHLPAGPREPAQLRP